jgi:hypothetical protein
MPARSRDPGGHTGKALVAAMRGLTSQLHIRQHSGEHQHRVHVGMAKDFAAIGGQGPDMGRAFL